MSVVSSTGTQGVGFFGVFLRILCIVRSVIVLYNSNENFTFFKFHTSFMFCRSDCGDAAGMGKSSRPGVGHETHQGRQACNHRSHAQGR